MEFVEKNYDAEVIYGDTDSIFIKFAFYDADGKPITGRQTLALGIEAGKKASQEIKKILPAPQSLEYEKTMFPFIIFSKKRYVGLLYEDSPDKKPKLKSMGIVLKRRDNAPIVKKIYGGIIDILLYKYNLNESVTFLKTELRKLINGEYPLSDLVITKTLKSNYKDRTKIAHCVLADRMGERDPGNKPQINDRLPYVYIKTNGDPIKLQGDRIEHPDYIVENNITPDYQFYITNQLSKPICQIYGLCVERLEGYNRPPDYWTTCEADLKNNKVYTDSELKRHNKILALKEQEANALLFNEFLEKKQKLKSTNSNTTKKKSKVDNNNNNIDLDPKNCVKLILKVTESKETNSEKDDHDNNNDQNQKIKIKNKSKAIWKGEYQIVLYESEIITEGILTVQHSKTTKTEATNKMMLELLTTNKVEIELEKGIILQLDKYYSRILKLTIMEHTEILDKLDKAQKECDMETFEKYTEMLKSFKVAQIIYKYKHQFV